MRNALNLLRSLLAPALLLSSGVATFAITFTNDTLISFNNTNFDGQDIVVTNCTLTVDGYHTFASVLVQSSGKLAHSYSTNGLLPNLLSITGEQQVLSRTILATLNSTNVLTNTVVITDLTGATNYGVGTDYAFFITGAIVQVYLVQGSRIAEGATVLVAYTAVGQPISAGLYLSVPHDIQIDVGGAVNADGLGYGPGLGQGAGASRATNSPYTFTAGSGGGYGGYGGASSTLAPGGNCYGSISAPSTLGSGGGAGSGPGGAGGGFIQLSVAGSIRVNGSITANGANGVSAHSGGGSGGGIYIVSPSISGNGTISANGGAGEPADGGGGGGGHIALSAVGQNIEGTLMARGGTGATAGGAGTVYYSVGISPAQLVVDNGGLRGTNTMLLPIGAIDLSIIGGAIAHTISPLNLHNLLIGSNSWLTVPGTVSTGLNTAPSLSVVVSGSATAQGGGGILLDGRGYIAGNGPGAGISSTSSQHGPSGSGGGYGGNGGAAITNVVGGLSYGSITSPTDFGSGGGGFTSSGGAGGGVLNLTVSGILQLDGVITAKGLPGSGAGGGGGAGGSIQVTANGLIGAGVFSADGGSAELPFGGGGGGGRIAVTANTNAFTGAFSARGGPGAYYGGAGTVYTRLVGNTIAQLLLDNGGPLGATNSGLNISGTYDLTIRGGASINPGASGFSSITGIRNLLIGTNGWLVFSNLNHTALIMNVAGSAAIQTGGGILLDAYGFPSGQGTGAGLSISGYGAGYGGYGGAGGSNNVSQPGGNAYGSLTFPENPGSGGASGPSQTVTVLGGAGGGAIHLTVSGNLALDGRISANGGAGFGLAAGGGSGGAVWLTLGGLSGAGEISANGGAGDVPGGGGGGGGRIAVYYASNHFTGIFSAIGAAGLRAGGAGTIYSKPTVGFGRLVVDNGGLIGTNTPLLSSLVDAPDLTISGGAILTSLLPALNQTLNNLVINSNSWLVLTNGSAPSSKSILAATNATIQAGGGISLDGKGYGPVQGPGAGSSSTTFGPSVGSGGGGYGGYGGAGLFGVAGGNSYGTFTAPSDPGSGGGGSGAAYLGGPGGGALQLTVAGTLAMDGQITANGAAALGLGGGGGAGGSLSITVGAISGAGLIAADGGAGDLPNGGGGGGGRIAITYATNQFTGIWSARGGVGANYGGAGTVYLLARPGNNFTYPLLIVNNGGGIGTNTPVQLSVGSPGFDLSILGGAVAVPTSGLVRNLLIGSNSWVTPNPSVRSSLVLQTSGSVTVQAGGGFTMDGKGYTGQSGLGYGGWDPATTIGGGGGYGGSGGSGNANAPGGLGFGSILQPVDIGCGGGGYTGFNIGGAGGGALHLIVETVLTLDGRISADGAPSPSSRSGGGSGGGLWISTTTLSGAGQISANGGAGDLPDGGGGGGGRIAIYYNTNRFTGNISARGGLGATYGGAGTVYSRVKNQATGQLVVDNGGASGASTPLTAPEQFNLTVSGGALGYPSNSLLVLSGLSVDSGGVLTHLNTQTNLDLLVFGNAVIGTNGSLNVGGKGYSGPNPGPGGGVMLPANGDGSGGGYGGVGGACASGTPGGVAYGSANQPTDRGSRGGLYPSLPNFCEGGGAIRMRVAGTLTLNGRLNANGNPAFFEGGGGGAGGSLWLTASTFDGSGVLTADGGPGEPANGGGGGGGRIAINARTNHFAGGYSALGGQGATWGGNGTIVITNIPAPQVVAQSPVGVVSYAVSYVDLTFDSMMKSNTASGADSSLDTPNGMLPAGSLTNVATSLTTVRVSFPAQNSIGYYELHYGPQIQDIYGDPMAAPYIGSFVIWPPVLSGRVTDAHGAPVPYATIRPSGGFLPTVTDATGFYSIEVAPNWAGTLTPARGVSMFIPFARVYTNVTSNLTNENFALVTPADLTISAKQQGPNLVLGWHGINGVGYQILFTTNMMPSSPTNQILWTPYAPTMIGTNGPMNFTVPTGSDPQEFFRFTTSY